MALRKRFSGKGEFKGVIFRIIKENEKAYLLELKISAKRLIAYQVIDNLKKEDAYPFKHSLLDAFKPFRTPNLKNAEKEFKKRSDAKN